MQLPRLMPAAIRRAFALLWGRFRAIFADAPLLFFGVVLGVALLFRLGVGAAREAPRPEVVAPTFVTGAEPGPSATTEVKLHADPSASALPTATATTATAAATAAAADAHAGTAEVGAAARVQPIGTRPMTPPRARPRSRGRARRFLRGAPSAAGEH